MNSASHAYDDIYVIDGQNVSQIMKHIGANSTNNWSPCLPTIFTFGSVTITFNSTNIQDINDWYPLEVCTQRKYTKNNYMFDSLGNMILLNLRINDYYIYKDTNYPLIHDVKYH